MAEYGSIPVSEEERPVPKRVHTWTHRAALVAGLGGVMALALVAFSGFGGQGGEKRRGGALGNTHAQERLDVCDHWRAGLAVKTDKVQDAYTIIFPDFASVNGGSGGGRCVWLLDNDGVAVHVWKLNRPVTQRPQLTMDGSLFFASVGRGETVHGNTATAVAQVGPDDVSTWSCEVKGMIIHHDMRVMPNGNALAMVWRERGMEYCVGPYAKDDGCMEDGVVELRQGAGDGSVCEVVWEWWVLDHAVQDLDPAAPLYGEVAAHPQLMDIGFLSLSVPEDKGPCGPPEGLLHSNSIDYDPVEDLIAISSFTKTEVFVIDHSTTTAEAASHSGGARGVGGDLMARWGNPNVREAFAADPREPGRRLRGENTSLPFPAQHNFHSHGVAFVHEEGHFCDGGLLIFNNGDMRNANEPDKPANPNMPESYSSADCFHPTTVRDARAGKRDELVWSYAITDRPAMEKWGGAQAMPNGNVFVSYPGGTRKEHGNYLNDAPMPTWMLREVNRQGDVVWELHHPSSSITFDQAQDHESEEPSEKEFMHDPFVFRAMRYPASYPGIRALFAAAK